MVEPHIPCLDADQLLTETGCTTNLKVARFRFRNPHPALRHDEDHSDRT